MVRSMLSLSPSERPEAADITAMSLFQELELPCRLAVRQRSRTYSSSSMGRPARQASSSWKRCVQRLPDTTSPTLPCPVTSPSENSNKKLFRRRLYPAQLTLDKHRGIDCSCSVILPSFHPLKRGKVSFKSIFLVVISMKRRAGSFFFFFFFYPALSQLCVNLPNDFSAAFTSDLSLETASFLTLNKIILDTDATKNKK